MFLGDGSLEGAGSFLDRFRQPLFRLETFLDRALYQGLEKDDISSRSETSPKVTDAFSDRLRGIQE